ncbi:MAG: response regulator transcription factor [Chloroflexi bacterium]|nr:response regulator transcription factor [Chloroflexota bacterium]
MTPYNPEHYTKQPPKIRRIVIVDDHGLIRQAMKVLLPSILQPAMIVAEGADGAEAVGLCQDFAPDLVFIDINMPKLNGVQATRDILAQFPHIQVVGLTSYGETEAMVQQLLEAGAIGCISKQANLSEIAQRFRQIGLLPAEPRRAPAEA